MLESHGRLRCFHPCRQVLLESHFKILRAARKVQLFIILLGHMGSDFNIRLGPTYFLLAKYLGLTQEKR